MSLPPLAPGRLVLKTAAEFVATLEREERTKFDCLVRYVTSLSDLGACAAFLERLRQRYAPAGTDGLRRAASAQINPGVQQQRPSQDYVSELEEIFE